MIFLSGKEIVKVVEELLTPILEENHYELYDLEFVKEGPGWYLRIYIDSPDGITIDDCELVSRKSEALLDRYDPIEQSYFLEVSSPGINRALKKDSDFERYKGQIVDLKLYKAIDRRKEFQGELVGLADGVITIKDENQELLHFNREAVAACRLAVIL